MSYPQRKNVVTSMVGLKSSHMHTNLTKKKGNPSDIAGNAAEEEEKEKEVQRTYPQRQNGTTSMVVGLQKKKKKSPIHKYLHPPPPPPPPPPHPHQVNSRNRAGNTEEESSTNDLKTGSLLARQPGTWLQWVSARTGWPRVKILWLGVTASLICNFSLSVATHTCL